MFCAKRIFSWKRKKIRIMCFATDDDFCPILNFESSKVNGDFFFPGTNSVLVCRVGSRLKWLFKIVKILCFVSLK